MAIPRSWLPPRINRGDKVSLDKPIPSQWVIGKPVNEHSYQSDEKQVESYVCAQFECHNVTDGKQGFMRIYVQVPHTGYERVDKATLAKEATQFTPPELTTYQFLTANHSRNTPLLLGYKTGTQPTEGPVPGGHITWIVWERVPGKCLGDYKSAFVYWDMTPRQRKRVREVFLREIPNIMKIGCFPQRPGPSNLIWDASSSALYFVGFRDSMPFKPRKDWDNSYESWLPDFDLAKPPQINFDWKIDYKGNMDGWKL